MRTALFWDFTQRRKYCTDVSGEPVGPSFNGKVVFGPIFKGKAVDCWTLEGGTYKFSRNVVKKLQ